MDASGDSGTTWRIVSVPIKQLDSASPDLRRQILGSEMCVVRKRVEDGLYEVAAEYGVLSRVMESQIQVSTDYNPVQPREAEKNGLGHVTATRRECGRWVREVVDDILYSEHCPQVKQAYKFLTRQVGLQRVLEREILIKDISECSTQMQRSLAQNCLFLLLSFVPDHSSRTVRWWLRQDQDELLDSLKGGLRCMGQVPDWPASDEAQKTPLFRALLNFSAESINHLRRDGCAEEYTINENSDLYSSAFNIRRIYGFGDCDVTKMYETLSKCLVFSDVNVNFQYVEDHMKGMKQALHLGLTVGFLDLPTSVFRDMSTREVKFFYAYMSNTYHNIPELRARSNNLLLLLTWGSLVSTWPQDYRVRHFEILRHWAKLPDGQMLYWRLVSEFFGPLNVAQLTLTTAAWINFLRLCPRFPRSAGMPVSGNYVANLDAVRWGAVLDNTGHVVERVAFAFARVLRSSHCDYDHLATFLETTVDRDQPSLDLSDFVIDQYLRTRMGGLDHDTAWRVSFCPSSTAGPATMYEVTPPEEYAVIRLVKPRGEHVLDVLEERLDTNIVPSICQLHDGSHELCVLILAIPEILGKIRLIVSDAVVDTFYDPLEPEGDDLNKWDYTTAKHIRRMSFSARARMQIEGTLPAAAGFYARYLQSVSVSAGCAAPAHVHEYENDIAGEVFEPIPSTPTTELVEGDIVLLMKEPSDQTT